jgi:hypothetical protein
MHLNELLRARDATELEMSPFGRRIVALYSDGTVSGRHGVQGGGPVEVNRPSQRRSGLCSGSGVGVRRDVAALYSDGTVG